MIKKFKGCLIILSLVVVVIFSTNFAEAKSILIENPNHPGTYLEDRPGEIGEDGDSLFKRTETSSDNIFDMKPEISTDNIFDEKSEISTDNIF